MSKRLAGGAINDLGIYASSVGYLFFKKKMKNEVDFKYAQTSITAIKNH